MWNLYEKGKGLNYALHKSLYRFLSKLKCYLDFTINIISEKYIMMIHWIQAPPRLQLESGRYMVDDNNPLMANRIKNKGLRLLPNTRRINYWSIIFICCFVQTQCILEKQKTWAKKINRYIKYKNGGQFSPPESIFKLRLFIGYWSYYVTYVYNNWLQGLGLLCLTPLSTIFQLRLCGVVPIICQLAT